MSGGTHLLSTRYPLRGVHLVRLPRTMFVCGKGLSSRVWESTLDLSLPRPVRKTTLFCPDNHGPRGPVTPRSCGSGVGGSGTPPFRVRPSGVTPEPRTETKRFYPGFR